MTTASDSPSTAVLDQVRAIFTARHRFSKDIVDRAIAEFGERWADECEETLQRCFPSPAELSLAVKGYAAFAFEAMRGQKRFEKERKYPAKTYAEAAKEVYLNDEYMMTQYLPGLLLSHFFWAHHYRQLQFFDSAFIQPMYLRGASTFAEVGIGTGLYSRRVLQHVPSIHGTGFDISPSSKAFAERHLAAFGLADRFEIVLQDVIATPIPACDWLVCVEVLEHLEDPVTFLRALRHSLTPGGRAFITAALNAANADHIYLYEKAEDVLAHLTEAGFALEQSFVGAAYKPATPDLPVPLAAAFVVF